MRLLLSLGLCIFSQSVLAAGRNPVLLVERLSHGQAVLSLKFEFATGKCRLIYNGEEPRALKEDVCANLLQKASKINPDEIPPEMTPLEIETSRVTFHGSNGQRWVKATQAYTIKACDASGDCISTPENAIRSLADAAIAAAGL